ncbi:MAG TPA: enoyl-CoA hydratase/isomerase family protein [Gemmatimonadaceae bacterium]|nr:enoyl-CoA hydratase/isomerase family protein [Gemmatimonadaceae bacterium]
MTGSASRIRVERDGAVATVLLDRAEKKNALDRAMADALRSALDELAAVDDVRVVVLRGAGPDFCAGADLEALERLLDAGADAHRDDARALGDVFLALRAMPQPVVAAVHGRALAGGAGLATACDIVLAHEGAQFGYPEVRIGFVPAMVMTMLRRAVGEKQAFDLVATGRVIGAEEAHRIGLVSRVLPASTFGAGVASIAEGLAGSPPGAMALTKRLFYELDALDFTDGVAAGVRFNVEARSTAEFREGLRRFLARRKGEA